MAAPAVPALLAVWEQGQDQSPTWRALALLGAATPEADGDALARWPLGRRDAALMRLRADLFGARVEAVAACPACAEAVELSFAPTDMDDDGTPAGAAPGAVTSADLLAVAALPAGERARAIADRHGPGEDFAAVERRLAAADPLARLEVALHCPACGHDWVAPFDVVGFLWAELHHWALRLLRDVHTLARAYGWAEKDILAMHPHRRRRYLELVAS
ncbi:phage baseplate protein [Specibacter cremeus]|uniref:phage baseplate protein n=1 Tax=Specibacter cremeus TaxID=1629051 RepID=UPI000F7AB3D3|nr:phage baseplate protein [Specibacter cremeus]